MAPSSFRTLNKNDCAFTASRPPTAICLVLQEVDDRRSVTLMPQIIARMAQVENWPDLEATIRGIIRTFIHDHDTWLERGDKRQRFDVSFLRGASDPFPLEADEDQELVTVLISATITMTVNRRVMRRDEPLRFHLTFQNPEEGAGAVLRYKEFDRSGPRNVTIDDYAFEPTLTFDAKFPGHTVMSKDAVKLLGDRVRKPQYDPFRYYDTVSIVPLEGERLVVYGGRPTYALDLATTSVEGRLRHPNEAAIASIVFEDGGGITFFYRLPPPPERGRGRGYARIDAFVDAALPIVPEPQRERGDQDYEDEDWGDHPWRDERDW